MQDKRVSDQVLTGSRDSDCAVPGTPAHLDERFFLDDITESGNSRQITLYQIDDRSALSFFRFALSRARLVHLRLQRPKTPAALYLEHAQGTAVRGRMCATSTGDWQANVIDSRGQRISLGKVVPPASENATGCYRLVGGDDAGLFELDGHTIRLVSGNDDGLFEMDEVTGELFWVGSTEDIEDTATVFELSVRIDVDFH